MGNGAQLSSRKRIHNLLDDNSFVEIGGRVKARNTDFNLQNTETLSDGVVTGYGTIDHNLVYVYSQEASVLNGSIGEMHAKKITNLYKLALKVGAPVIGLIDCAGLRLQEATDALNGFGEIYLSQTLASGVIPQITGVFGMCGGGVAIIPSLTDFTFMEEKNAKLFVNSPNAMVGNEISKIDSTSAKFQSEEAGLVDVIASEEEIFLEIRKLISIIPSNNEDDMSYDECRDDLNRLCDGIQNAAGDAKITLSQISDNHFIFETKRDYAKDMVTAFIRLNGITVGAVANRREVYNEEGTIIETFDGRLSSKAAEKAAEFISFCDAFNIPILSLTNVNGYNATLSEEKQIAKATAKLIYAFANATVPKVNVMIGEALGSSYLAMNSKSIGADIVMAWPSSFIGMMDAKEAVKIMYANELKESEDSVALMNEKVKEYTSLQTSIESAASRGYVDDIISPENSRKHIIGAFEMLFTKREDRPRKKHGCVL